VKREARWRAGFVVSLTGVFSGLLLACSSDPVPDSRGAGGAAGAAGAVGTGGKGTGGAVMASGGRGNAGATAAGGTGTGGNGGRMSPLDGGVDAHPAQCTAPKVPVYEAPGCDGVSTPVCALPDLDACLIEVCACDGTTLSGCGDFTKPYRHKGACADASAPASDSGMDAH
jgi:hypothetical protein